jgi:hypothetical protein
VIKGDVVEIRDRVMLPLETNPLYYGRLPLKHQHVGRVRKTSSKTMEGVSTLLR